MIALLAVVVCMVGFSGGWALHGLLERRRYRPERLIITTEFLDSLPDSIFLGPRPKPADPATYTGKP